MSFPPAHILATKITLIITGVLLILIFFAYLIGGQSFREGSKKVFLERVDRLSGSQNNTQNPGTRRGPPNIIILEGDTLDIR